MNCCPSSVLDLGCFPCTTDPISLAAETYDISGTWIVVFGYHGLTHQVNLAVSINDPIQIPTGTLNETYLYTAQLYRPDGSIYTWDSDPVYNGFRFQRKMEI